MMDTFAKDIDQIIDQLEFNDKKPIKVSIKSYEKIYFPTGKYPLCVKPQKNQDSRWNIYECKENPTIDIVREKKIFRLSKLNKTMYHDTKCNVSYKLKGGKIVIDKYRSK